jgi:hypothetical protein
VDPVVALPAHDGDGHAVGVHPAHDVLGATGRLGAREQGQQAGRGGEGRAQPKATASVTSHCPPSSRNV